MGVGTAEARQAVKERQKDAAAPGAAGIPAATESAVTQIWEEILKRKGISTTEDFFDLGGTSLDLIRVFGRVNDRFGVNLDGSVLEDEATVARLVKCINAGTRA